MLLCGTRKVVKNAKGYRVVCATCENQHSAILTIYPTAEQANTACVRDSNKPCNACGAV